MKKVVSVAAWAVERLSRMAEGKVEEDARVMVNG